MYALTLDTYGNVTGVAQAVTHMREANTILMDDIPANLLDGTHKYRFIGSLIDITGVPEPEPTPAPERPVLKLLSVAVTSAQYVARTRINLDAHRVDSCVGAELLADVEILLDDVRLPLTDTFALPLLASDGREHLVEAVFENGLGQVRVPLTASGAWQVTEAEINKRLPEAMHMKFSGVAIYVVA